MNKLLLLLSVVIGFLCSCNEHKNSTTISSSSQNKLPIELKPFSRFLNDDNIELSIKNNSGFNDTLFVIKKLFHCDSTSNDIKFAFIVIRYIYGFPNQNFSHNTNIYFFKYSNNKWFKIGTYEGLYVECHLEYLTKVLNYDIGESFLLKANRDGLYYIFVSDKSYTKFTKFDKSIYFQEYTDKIISVISAKDTFPYKSNNLPLKYRVYEEYYQITLDSMRYIMGRYNSIHNNYLVSKWIDMGIKYGRKEIHYDSIKISELNEVRAKAYNWK